MSREQCHKDLSHRPGFSLGPYLPSLTLIWPHTSLPGAGVPGESCARLCSSSGLCPLTVLLATRPPTPFPPVVALALQVLAQGSTWPQRLVSSPLLQSRSAGEFPCSSYEGSWELGHLCFAHLASGSPATRLGSLLQTCPLSITSKSTKCKLHFVHWRCLPSNDLMTSPYSSWVGMAHMLSESSSSFPVFLSAPMSQEQQH